MKEKSYNLFGSTWKIQFVDEVVGENDKWLFGETESPSRVITISTKKPDGSKLSKDEIELTVLHEIVHSIFQTGQYMSCDNDEPLVEWTARCLKALKEQPIELKKETSAFEMAKNWLDNHPIQITTK